MALQLLLVTLALTATVAKSVDDPFMANPEGPCPTYSDWNFHLDGEGNSKERALQQFENWLAVNTSIYAHPHAKLRFFNDRRRFGVIATKDFHDLEVLSRIPDEDMIIGASIMLSYSQDPLRQCDFGPNKYPISSPKLTYLDTSILGGSADMLVLKVIYELLIGPASRWEPFINIFPSVGDFEMYMPSYWAGSDVNSAAREEWDRGGDDYHRHLLLSLETQEGQFLAYMRNMCADFGYDATPLMRRLLCDERLHLWSMTIQSTRGWSRENSQEALEPLNDMFNHGDGGNSVFYHSFEGKQGAMVATQATTATSAGPMSGEELTQTYKRHQTHPQFFVRDGFVSEAGSVLVPPKVIGADSVGQGVRKKMAELQCWMSPMEFEYHPTRLRDASICALSVHTYTCYRLLVSSMTAKQMKKAVDQHKKRVDELSNSDIWLSDTHVDSGIDIYSKGAPVHTFATKSAWFDIHSLWKEAPEDAAVWRAMVTDLQTYLDKFATTYEEDRHLADTGEEL